MASATEMENTDSAVETTLGSPIHHVTESEAMEAVLNQVKFVDVKQCYPPSQDIDLRYSVGSDVEMTSHDWVGVYKVGWKSPKSDYYTFVWSPIEGGEGNQRSVLFQSRYLPSDDSSYQFCYVTKAGDIRGFSSAFQIKDDFVDDDIECVELEEDLVDAVLVQSRERRARDQEELDARCSDLQGTVLKLEAREDDLKSQIELLSQQRDNAVREGERSAAKVTELDLKIEQLFAKVDELNDDKANAVLQKHSNAMMVEEIESKLNNVVNQLESSLANAASLAQEQEQLKAENKDLQESSKLMAVELQEVNDKLAGTRTELQAVAARFESSSADMDNMAECLEQKCQEEERLTEALQMVNQRNEADRELLGEKNQEIHELCEKLVALETGHAADDEHVYGENCELKEQNVAAQRMIESLQGETTALRMALSQVQHSQRDEESTQCTDVAIAQSNLTELAGENQDLKRELGDLTERLRAAEEAAAAATARDTSSANDQALFALQRAFDDSQQKCNEIQAAYRQQARLARAAEATVKLLEGEMAEQTKTSVGLKRRLQEGGEHYKAKYKECAELERRLRSRETDAAGMVSSDQYSQLSEQFDAVVAERNDLQVQVEEMDDALAICHREKLRLERESCNQLILQSVRSLGVFPDSSSPAASEQPAAVMQTNRSCPVCGTDLPWSMEISAVEQHCASHFDDN